MSLFSAVCHLVHPRVLLQERVRSTGGLAILEIPQQHVSSPPVRSSASPQTRARPELGTQGDPGPHVGLQAALKDLAI